MIGRLASLFLALGSALFLVGGAQAFALPPSAGGGVSWESIGTLALGLVVSLVAAYVKGLQATVKSTNDRVNALSDRLHGEHYDKAEASQVIASAIEPLKVELRHIGRTLEGMARDGIARDRREQSYHQDDGA